MYVLAARSWALSTWLATGRRPVLAPPLRAATFDPSVLVGQDLVYVCLHGLPGQPYWYGSDWSTAVTADQLRRVDLSGVIVYAAGCFGQGPMAAAMGDAGVRP